MTSVFTDGVAAVTGGVRAVVDIACATALSISADMVSGDIDISRDIEPGEEGASDDLLQ